MGIYWGFVGDLLGIYWGFISDLLGIYWGFIGGIIPTVTDVIAQERGLIYSKYMGLLVIDGINGIKKKEERDECVMDLYMYASSQHLDSGLHLKLQ